MTAGVGTTGTRNPWHHQNPLHNATTHRGARMSRTRIHNLAISLDGFATGEPQSAEAPFGHAGERLHEWMFGTRFWDAGGSAESTTPSPCATARHRRRDHGRQQVRPARLAGRPGLEGLVGAEPAVPHADLRAHPPPAAPDRDGGRHDVPLPRRRPGRGARDRPRGRRWPGRPDRRRRHRRTRLPRRRARRPLHLVQVPIVLGRGVRVWDGLEALEDAYDIEAVSSPSGVTHLTFTRRADCLTSLQAVSCAWSGSGPRLSRSVLRPPLRVRRLRDAPSPVYVA